MSRLSLAELDVLLVEPSSTQHRIIDGDLADMGATHVRHAHNARQADVIAILSKPFSEDQLRSSLLATVDFLEPDQSRLAGVAQSGVSAVFDKPFTVDTLRTTIQRLLI